MVWALLISVLLHSLWVWVERPTLQSAGASHGQALEVRLPAMAATSEAPPPRPVSEPPAQPSATEPAAEARVVAQASSVDASPGELAESLKNVRNAASTVNEPVSPDPQQQEAARMAAEAAVRAALEAKMAPYRAGGLDPGPVPLGEIDPEYPEAAGKRQGIVRLTLLINEEGIVDEAIVVYSRPAAMFDDAAVTAFSQARFTPGKFMGIPVKSRLTVEVEFTPINRGGAVTGRGY